MILLCVNLMYLKIEKMNCFLFLENLRHYKFNMEPHKCDLCNDPTKAQFVCSKCETKHYCSSDCQKKDWKYHKTICDKKLTVTIYKDDIQIGYHQSNMFYSAQSTAIISYWEANINMSLPKPINLPFVLVCAVNNFNISIPMNSYGNLKRDDVLIIPFDDKILLRIYRSNNDAYKLEGAYWQENK
jgi:hypothetical protein